MSDIDVTEQVAIWGMNDDESLPLKGCACGRNFDYYDFILGLEPQYARACPGCGRRLYWEWSCRVYEVK